MAAYLEDAFMEILSRPTIWGMILGMIMLLGPVWIGFLVGILAGWAWKPRWATLRNCNKFDFSAPSSPCSSPSSSAMMKATGFGPTPTSDTASSSSSPNLDDDNLVENQQIITQTLSHIPKSSSSQVKEESLAVTDEDMKHLCRLVERKDCGPPWKHMMERSTSDMSYQAWQRDPETGPPQYCSRTVYEDATPELLRDFFWDDEFRVKWDDMLVHAKTLEECPTTGTMIVHWIRKFPFFCSDREYIIGRRIWESGRSYYCVTKGIPCDSIPRRDKPRRVDLYYSSWYIQAVESRKVKGQLSACEVILFHHEDMGIPWEIAKFGVRQGMWGTVRKIERGFRLYQKTRLSGEPISNSAFMAQINTKIDPDYLKSLDQEEEAPEAGLAVEESTNDKPRGGLNIPKLVIIGGVVALACSLDRGMFTKAIIFSVAKKFSNVGRNASRRTM
ncbi:OLC1v1020930C1 [Oldenlandia corymbosa var. corymbosa]|uniref:OLC1v1020930C1 n=1 Tax=Oldenlandia corymbosa var. corymbosa TaxID=529605 RepID=A0AAV1BWP5_OLDCO|nr:OLC1v1020930C1 [Oldenlandia corymbosa var. corymbosa]